MPDSVVGPNADGTPGAEIEAGMAGEPDAGVDAVDAAPLAVSVAAADGEVAESEVVADTPTIEPRNRLSFPQGLPRTRQIALRSTLKWL